MSFFAPSMPNGLPPEKDHYQRMLNFEVAQSRRLNLARQQRYLLNRRYFYGENEDPDNVKQPLGIRYVPTVNQKHTHYLFGEWEKDILNWSVVPWGLADDDGDEKEAQAIQRAIYRLLRRANFNQVAYLGGMDGSVYGDTVFKVAWKPNIDGAGIESILPEYFHAIWHPLDISQTLECCVAYNVDRVTSQSMFGTPGSNLYSPEHTRLNTGLAIAWEYWNAFTFTQGVDSQIVYEGPNIYARHENVTGQKDAVRPGHLPFVHIPNLGINGEYWGFGDAEQIFRLADELNMRLADLGDVVSYHAHPITVLKNFFGDVQGLPVGPDSVWDLGREGEAAYLEWGGPQPQVLEYISLLLRIIMETTNLTPIAFGQIEASQASSAALNIQMLPVTEVVRRKRAIWGRGMLDLVEKLIRLEYLVLETQAKGKFKATYGFEPDVLGKYQIAVKWAPILPKDQLAAVNENVSLISNNARSIVEALINMGNDDPEAERARIMKDMEDIADIQAKAQMEITNNEAVQNIKIAKAQAAMDQDGQQLQMQASAQEHKQTMAQDPTTDPARHERHLATMKTQGDEERKTLQTKAKVTTQIERVKQQTFALKQRGGKNSDRGSGGSNQDGGN